MERYNNDATGSGEWSQEKKAAAIAEVWRLAEGLKCFGFGEEVQYDTEILEDNSPASCWQMELKDFTAQEREVIKAMCPEVGGVADKMVRLEISFAPKRWDGYTVLPASVMVEYAWAQANGVMSAMHQIDAYAAVDGGPRIFAICEPEGDDDGDDAGGGAALDLPPLSSAEMASMFMAWTDHSMPQLSESEILPVMIGLQQAMAVIESGRRHDDALPEAML